MAQAKKKTATKTKKSQPRKTGSRANTRTSKKQGRKQEQKSNMFFVISMSVLAATLLFADLLMIVA